MPNIVPMPNIYGGQWQVHKIRLNWRGGLELWFRRRILRQHLVVFRDLS